MTDKTPTDGADMLAATIINKLLDNLQYGVMKKPEDATILREEITADIQALIDSHTAPTVKADRLDLSNLDIHKVTNMELAINLRSACAQLDVKDREIERLNNEIRLIAEGKIFPKKEQS